MHRVRVSKALIIAPTVPIVRQQFNIAKQMPNLRPKCIIGSAEVDMWGQEQWHEAVMGADLLITTAQLFLDALNAHYVHLSSFCVMVVDECQHSSGSHPFAKIFSKHYLAENSTTLAPAQC